MEGEQEDLRREREAQERLRREKEEANAHLRAGERGRPSAEGDKMVREPKRVKSNVDDDEALARRLQKELEEQELQNRGFPVDVGVEAQLATPEKIRPGKEKRNRITKAEEAAAQAAFGSSKFNPPSAMLFVKSLTDSITEADLRGGSYSMDMRPVSTSQRMTMAPTKAMRMFPTPLLKKQLRIWRL